MAERTYRIGFIEDEPGKKFWVIGEGGCFFARIEDTGLQRQIDLLQDLVELANRASSQSAKLAEQERVIEGLTRELDGWKSQHDMILAQARKDNARAEDADRYELWLLELGKLSGCAHLDEGLPRCIEQAFEKLVDERDRYKELYEPFRPLSLEEAAAAFDAQEDCPPMPPEKVEHGLKYVLDAEYRVAGRRAVAEAAASLEAKQRECDELRTALGKAMRFVPRPEDMPGYNDPDAPDEILAEIELAKELSAVPGRDEG